MLYAKTRCLLALHRIGPYHHARFLAAASLAYLRVLETRPQSQEYLWRFQADAVYGLHQLYGHHSLEEDPPSDQIVQQLAEILDQLQPQTIVSVGWADRAYQALLVLAHQRRIPVVLISDSRQRDEPRSATKEWIKRQLLRGYSAALVAGKESRAYLTELGFPPAAIAQPWDVVDNAFFAQAAASAGPRQPHFLCVSRLVAKKNHAGLLQAYATYQRQGGRWGLQLVGSGPLEPAIRDQIAELPDPQRVQLLPFCQLEELGPLYGQASAFVLASSTDQWGLVVNEAMAAGLPCLVSSAGGCAVDLVEHGVSGWCFDPTAPSALAALLLQAERQSPDQRAAMQQAAHQRLQAFTPETFASGLQQALQWAIAQPRFSRRAALTAALLCRRP
ncbi:glycosyltransferase [Synechococcus sp. CCY9201]|uniref:glycosyltransferase family 4 protein n=1 Tax=Synechococcus sp. CCY9201 TaxID=174697 RepID=UPI002B21CCF0|nr:glycosyltransferase [Synechococcus sp. CCY9201]MEA5474688.1 glycosyltransferase [Synechococcus sp. CCY9201]